MAAPALAGMSKWENIRKQSGMRLWKALIEISCMNQINETKRKQ